jgi:hypothetical protein
MLILVNDYRGDHTQINSRGDTLYQHRTRYFLKMQQDFAVWQRHGHHFICFTQHTDSAPQQFDLVIPVPRNTVAHARNVMLDWLQQQRIKDDWIGLWDNDVTLYWPRLQNARVPKELHMICRSAQDQNIHAWVPMNPQHTPYRDRPQDWQFQPTIQMKGSMTFIRNPSTTKPQRFNTSVTTMDDLVWAIEQTQRGNKVAILQQASLNELVKDKSTIFRVEPHRVPYKRPGARANPLGLTHYDGQRHRLEQFGKAEREIALWTGRTLQDWQHTQRQLWQQKNNTYERLFQEE